MTQDVVDSDDLMQLAATDPARAHAEARRRVASDPSSEQAAIELRHVFRRFPPVSSAPVPDPLDGAAAEVKRAADLLEGGNMEQAEIALRAYVAHRQLDPQAMRLMAQIAAANDLSDRAYKILLRSLEVDRLRADNWIELGKVIHRISSTSGQLDLMGEAFAALDHATALVPHHPEAMSYQASILIQLRRLEEAIEVLEALFEAHPGVSNAWINYGYSLNTLGRFGEAVAAYRTAVAVDPANGEAWWGLANLKRSQLFAADIAEIEEQLPNAGPRGQVTLNFALANAQEHLRDFARAAEHLEVANRLWIAHQPYEPARLRAEVDSAIAVYTPEFFIKRRGAGDPSKAPIFIVGMPRSGSTLIEQILSSHSMVQGTEELYAIPQLETEIYTETKIPPVDPVDTLVEQLGAARLTELGGRYLHLTRHHWKGGRPRFTDKYPANWRHVGLIHAILPNAKIIDTRRNPMDCCFSNYAQFFPFGAGYTYRQSDLAATYLDYLRLMRHFDRARPGLVHRVIHDDLVDNFQDEVRRLLDYLELPFEDSCMRFFDTERPVHTPSSAQVRQPINRSGFGRWRSYEPWLGELQAALGDTVDNWRD